MLTKRTTGQFALRLLQIAGFSTAFVTMWFPQAHGAPLRIAVNVLMFLVLAYHVVKLYKEYKRGLLSKTIPQLYAEAKVRPLVESKTEAFLDLSLLILLSMAVNRL